MQKIINFLKALALCLTLEKGKNMKSSTLFRVGCLALAFILTAAMLVSCTSGDGTGFISSVDEDGMYVVIEEDEVRVDFLKETAPVTEEESQREDFVNVLDFGAVGDGVTNDTVACQKALRKANHGGVVYFPAGTYLVTKQLYAHGDNVVIKGDGNATKIIYQREQKTIDQVTEVSLWGLRAGARNVTIRDMYMEYRGEYFPNFGSSYSGKINGIYITEAHDILIENVEITGFNSSAINLAGNPNAYATDIVVRDCYLHHNRVAGVLYGYVDGLIITNSVMEYQGSSLDGGTGYGSAGSSGAYPENVRVLNNECNYNQRKGIDLHAGENVIIEGNTCKGNRLYGMYVEGSKSNHVVIKNNIVSDMGREKLDIGSPYTWLSGIDIGTASDDPDRFYDYEVVGNIIEGHGLVQGSAYGICGYFAFTRGKVTIKDNIMRCDEITNFIRFSGDPTVTNKTDINFIIEGNQLYAKKAKYHSVMAGRFNSLIFTNNTVVIDECTSSIKALHANNNASASTTIVSFNVVTAPKMRTTPFVFNTERPSGGFVKENNIFNGKKID